MEARDSQVTEPVPGSAKHSAAGSAAGFEHQRQLALVLLAEAYPLDPSVKARLEVAEDIDLTFDANAAAHIEVKHHLKDGVLTEFTAELWRTFEIWLDTIEEMPSDDWPRFLLATTATAKVDSAPYRLREGGRQIEEALNGLLHAAETSTSEDSKKARDRFRQLDRHRQLALLNQVTVLDGTPPVTKLEPRLRQALALGLPRTQIDLFMEGIHGWWVGQSVRLLAGDIPWVSGADLQDFCSSLRDNFNSRDLVAHPELSTDPTEDEKEPYRDKRFVQQLEIVDADLNAIDLAIRHYYRAFAQRGRWTRELEDLGDDLDQYEKRLHDEWEIAHVGMCNRLTEDDRERRQEGLRLSSDFGFRASARLRGLDEPVLRQGTLHGLADNMEVGWHPDFRQVFAAREAGS